MMARWMRFVGLTLTLALIMALGACSLILDSPTVRVSDVQASSIGLSGGTLRLRLEIQNPNSFELSAESFAYRFDIGEEGDRDEEPAESAWTNIFDGVYPGAVDLPGKGTTNVEVEVPFQYGSVGTVVGRLLRQGEVEYRFSGLFRFRFLVGGVNVPFDEHGTFRP